MGFSVYCYLPIIFSVDVKLANFLMFTVSDWPKIPRYTKQNNFGLLAAVFASFRKKITVSENFLQLVLKCLKFNCFMLQSQKMKCLVLSWYPHSDPHEMEGKSVISFRKKGLRAK